MKTSLSILTVLLNCLPAAGAESFAAHWEFVGVAVSEPGYHVWGSSPILDAEGKVHLFVARWPRQYRAEPGFDLIEAYVGKEKLKNAVQHYGGKIKFERPQLLLIDGKPKYLYAPSGYNIFGGDSTVSYVLRFNEQ